MVSTDGLDDKRLTLIEFPDGRDRGSVFPVSSHLSLSASDQGTYRTRMIVCLELFKTAARVENPGQGTWMKAFVREAAAQTPSRATRISPPCPI